MDKKEKKGVLIYYILTFLCIVCVINVFALKMQGNDANEETEVETEMVVTTEESTEETQEDIIDGTYLEMELPIAECGIVDFEINGNVLTSTSQDPWLDYHFAEAKDIAYIEVDIKEMSVDELSAMIFYDVEDYISGNSYIEVRLHEGKNVIRLQAASDIRTIRMDLTDKSGVVINLNSINVYYN